MAYKNEKQYTSLIHAGENVTIAPPGFINSEGGGGGVSPDDIKAPFYFYNKENEAIGFLSADGDLHTDGTVYINSEGGAEGTDIRELSPIFDIDIVGDYTNGTFTSSQTFAEITEAMETGHTLIARDTNGFVYTQAASEFDPETTDIITFSSVQPDGLYYLYWTGSDRTIGFKSNGGKIEVVEADGRAVNVVFAEITEILSNDKIPVIILGGLTYTLTYNQTTSYWFTNISQEPTRADNNLCVKIIRLTSSSTSNVNYVLYNELYQYKDNQGLHRQIYVHAGSNYLWTHPTEETQTYQLSYLNVFHQLRYYATSNYVPSSPYKNDKIIYVENGNYHVCTLAEIPANDYIDYGSSIPRTYKFRCIEPYSSNTIIIYELSVNVTSTTSYNVTVTTNTYTIGS